MNRPYFRLIGVLAFVGLFSGACSSSEEAATSEVEAITVPDEIIAGDSISVDVEVAGAGPITIEVIDAFSTTTLSYEAEERTSADRIVVEIPPRLTRSSGVITFRAHGALGDDARAATLVMPSTAVDPVDVLVGPRTVVANGADETMAIGFVTDRFGNPLVDGTIVDLTMLDESNGSLVLEAEVEGGLAPRLIGSGTVAQRVDVFASVDDGRIASRRVAYQEVPGPTARIDLDLSAVDDSRLIADGRTSIDVHARDLVDRFGNRLIDGRLVRLETVGPDGVGQLTARTIDGIARFDLVAPARPGVVTLRVDADGVSSTTTELDYSPAVSELPVILRGDPLGVSIGPVLDARGAVVADGTIAEVVVRPTSDEFSVIAVSEVQLIDGRATVDLDDLDDLDEVVNPMTGDVVVTVLGVARSARVT